MANHLRLVLIACAALAAGACRPGSEAEPPSDRAMAMAAVLDVDVRSLGGSTILEREVVGSFSQHRAVLDQVALVVERTGARPTGDPLGIYPEDPDVVGMDYVTWSIAVPIQKDPGIVGVDGWRIRELPPVTALVATTTVAESHSVGLALKIWTLKEGYVQTAPTRMRFRQPIKNEPQSDTVDIIFPVVKRSEL